MEEELFISNLEANCMRTELYKKEKEIQYLKQEVFGLKQALKEANYQSALLSNQTQKVSSPLTKGHQSFQLRELGRSDANAYRSNGIGCPVGIAPVTSAPNRTDGPDGLVKPGFVGAITSLAGEYLISALNSFSPEQYDSLPAMTDGANKLLMLVLAAVIKAGASMENEILAEIRDAVFSFIRKLEPMGVLDIMLVSRVRILYVRSLIARSPELQSIKVSPIECFLEKANTGCSRSSSQCSTPARSPVSYFDQQTEGFKVKIKPEKRSKFLSVVLKLRRTDKETWRQHITSGKLREITEEAKNFAIGNKALASLFVHTPAGELQHQIGTWLAENFEFLSVTGDDTVGETTGQKELLATVILDGWTAGLGAALPPYTDALGQLLSVYTKRIYLSQLQHLKDIASTLTTEDAEDPAHVAKLRSALESIDHKKRKILQQMRNDIALQTWRDDSPIQSPSTAVDDSQSSFLTSPDGILKPVKEDIMGESSVKTLSKSRKRSMLVSLNEFAEWMPSLHNVVQQCAQRQIAYASRVIELIPEEDDRQEENLSASKLSAADMESKIETDVGKWSILQFNTGCTTHTIRCGANSKLELVIKANEQMREPTGNEVVRIMPRPSFLENLSLEEIKQVFCKLPEAVSSVVIARTANGTRARYSRLYRTLALKIPSLAHLVGELEMGGKS